MGIMRIGHININVIDIEESKKILHKSNGYENYS